jgi:maleate cis-trans isomerase
VRQYYTWNVSEQSVPQNSVATDSLGFGIFNTTAGASQTQLLQLNYSYSGGAQKNNATYVSDEGYMIPVVAGFRTEKGSKVASISPTSDTFQMATSVDQLQFALTNTGSNTVVSKAHKTVGPYSVGQATNLPNVSIAAVNATPVLSGSSTYTILGESNLTATPSVTSATTPVLLKNLSTTAPLVVLDSNANTGSNLILVGSGYVNSLSAQLQKAYNVSITSPSSAVVSQAYGGNRILVAGYTAAQTTSAANSFISQLYTAAASST